MIDTNNGAARLLDFLPDQTMPTKSLQDLTGDNVRARVELWPSGLARRIAEAWVLPMTDLNCGLCRMLVGQCLGLEWLASPVTTFSVRFPQAECDLYPGDLTVISLVTWRDLAPFARDQTWHMLRQDYDWLRREAAEDDRSQSILKQAVAALDEALQN